MWGRGVNGDTRLGRRDDKTLLYTCELYLPSRHTTTTTSQCSLSGPRWQRWSCGGLRKPGRVSCEGFRMQPNTHTLALRPPHGLIHTQNQRSGFRSAVDRIYLDQTRFPNESLHIVTNTLGSVNVNAEPDVPVRVAHPKLV